MNLSGTIKIKIKRTMTPLHKFQNAVWSVLSTIHSTPQSLKEGTPIMKAILQSQGKAASQGTGNAVTAQEASFAAILETNGFKFLAKPKKDAHLKGIKYGEVSDGLYYIYQVNGNQQSIDFQAMLVQDKSIKTSINFDLKHTLNDILFLNDGWFHSNVVYVVSWTDGTADKTFIGLGQNIPTDEETEMMKLVVATKVKLNSEKKSTGNLMLYFRFANRYSCKRFTDVFTAECFSKTRDFVYHQLLNSTSNDTAANNPSPL